MERKGLISLLILKILSEGEASGYDIMKKCGEVVGKKPSPGTVYPALRSLERGGLIRSKKSGRRRVYRLTELGVEYSERTKKLKSAYMAWLENLAKVVGHLFNMEKEKEFVSNEEIHWYLVAKLSPLAKEIVRLKEARVRDDEIDYVLKDAVEKLRGLARRNSAM
ncbi:MAG: hypothetical protein DRN20_03435 [Thermoplasmata archaeon]|nr:MAG: hypothetical protein DRN20_03435 [Thermoplasmata archaeon]